MAETGHDFGRFDFLRAGGRLVFLEMNPKGQFAWLDPDGARGLLDAVAAEVLAVARSGRRLAWRPPRWSGSTKRAAGEGGRPRPPRRAGTRTLPE